MYHITTITEKGIKWKWFQARNMTFIMCVFVAYRRRSNSIYNSANVYKKVYSPFNMRTEEHNITNTNYLLWLLSLPSLCGCFNVIISWSSHHYHTAFATKGGIAASGTHHHHITRSTRRDNQRNTQKSRRKQAANINSNLRNSSFRPWLSCLCLCLGLCRRLFFCKGFLCSSCLFFSLFPIMIIRRDIDKA